MRLCVHSIPQTQLDYVWRMELPSEHAEQWIARGQHTVEDGKQWMDSPLPWYSPLPRTPLETLIMKLASSLVAIAASLSALATATRAAEPAEAPAVFNVKAKHLSPEDCAFDIDNKQWYQSNLCRGKIHVAGMDGSSFSVSIPQISSDEPFDTPYQLAGLSLNNRTAPTRLYAVAKDEKAFRFKSSDATQSVSKLGPNRFVAYDLPLTTKSQPAWSIRLDRVQDRLKKKLGGKNRPFGPVDSVQDSEGNSYVVFALGAPAIAKISPSGEAVQAWAWETPKSSRAPRVGYTGIAYDADSNRLIAYGGPRVLTMFDLSSDTPSKPIAVKIEGDLSVSDLTSAEKINLIPCE